ncbi:hypothetical protein A2774_04665 [Candidatus Roizmanbacteria bacterium RIFCSPHIGHO2_01_FULL_39_12c]|uniref:Uncharacterized protein n=1 Tax=Candidatus Roizmanbacteria bacterium RIFCSPHIGHO2_01_FULL_39_12c TaxID=1802031 RepID=A0A1F7GBF3_9BACT|nr:MAG: hypothetical protein A2774_04665 [Candidatus Roizmanbacteria bacterium RIFCSPHIGHO2_01_FULL_39_12c]
MHSNFQNNHISYPLLKKEGRILQLISLLNREGRIKTTIPLLGKEGNQGRIDVLNFVYLNF